MRRMNNKLYGRRTLGFTLIEVMVVIAILGILAALIVPNLTGKDDIARVQVAKSDIKQISSALEMYKLDNLDYPTTDQGLEALSKKPDTVKNWPQGGYLKKTPVDPWGKPYLFLSPADSAPYDLISYGADGQEGGEGVKADISLSEI